MTLTGWNYRKSHLLTSGSTLTDYQIKVRVYRTSGTDTTDTVYIGSKCLSNYNDIRFTTDDGNTLIPYWIEYSDSSYADIWLKVPSISTTTIYIYYGNSSATAVSSGDSTFIFFDNFSGNSLNATKWPSSANTIFKAIDNKITIVDATKSGDSYWIFNNTDIGSQIISNAVISTNCEIICKQTAYDNSGTQMGQVGIAFTTPNAVQAYICHSDGNGVDIALNTGFVIGSTTNFTAVTPPDTRFLSLKKLGTSYTASHKINISDTWTVLGTVTNSSSVTKFAIAAGAYGGYPFLQKVEVYYVFIKNAATIEPTHETWGSEEFVGGKGLYYTPSNGEYPTTVNFYLNGYEEGLIDFGDGVVSREPITTHTYSKPGVYTLYAIGTDTTDSYVAGEVGYTGESTSTIKSIRNEIRNTAISAYGDKIQILMPYASVPLNVVRCSIVAQDPDNLINGITTPTVITYNGHESFIIPAETNIWSDIIDYTIKADARYLFIIDIDSSGGIPDIQYEYYMVGSTYNNAWYSTDYYTSAEKIPSGTFTDVYYLNWFGPRHIKIIDAIDTYTVQDAITITAPPVTTNFTYVVTNNIVTFTDSSTSQINEWMWNFGDENISVIQNPTHEYYAPGIYNVRLDSSNGYNSSNTTKQVTIANTSIFWPQNVAFTYDQFRDETVCRVEFYGTSTPNKYTPNTSYLWNFGDGNTSTLLNPIHYYNTAGTYTVSFTVYNTYGSSSITHTVIVRNPVIVDFTPSFKSGALPLTVQFTNTTYPSSEVLSQTWDFGDSTTSTSANPSHTYTTPGIYSPILTITYWGGSKSKTKSNSIIANIKTYTIKDTIEFGESGVSNLESKIFIDSLSFPTEVCAPGFILTETLPFKQGEYTSTPGFDEFGYGYSGRFTHFGHRVFSTLTKFGRKLVKLSTFQDLTGVNMAYARKFKETVYFENELSMEFST